MHTVSDALTKASTNSLSPSLPVFRLSHSPNCSNLLSRLIASPMSDPKASDAKTIMEPVLAMLPSGAAVSMPASAPESPTKSTLTPWPPSSACPAAAG